MKEAKSPLGPNPRLDPAALFARLGLSVADERPIMESWRQANRQWRQRRREQIDAHAVRIADHDRRYVRVPANADGRANHAKPKPVWCVELCRRFESMTAAARFVGRNVSNIHQSLRRGVRCGGYHWREVQNEQ